jgi:hypothetical protein
MTDLQDLILDKLVGSKVGANLPDSPLTIAASLIESKRPIAFGKSHNDAAMSEIARRLGWPVLLAEGFQGGVRALKDEEDRRRLAMTVFRVVQVGGPQPKLTGPEQAKIAAAAAVAVHPFVCTKPKCQWAGVLLAITDRGHTRPANRRAYTAHCLTAHGKHPVGGAWLHASSDDEQRLIVMGQHVENALKRLTKTAGYAVREAVRLAVTRRGITEAVALIADIARRCGMATEAV